MRLIEQTVLEFREGTSDKVYEVDLCEAGEGEFLVNFRYGRRGARLQEGTKTVFPESRERATALYQALVNEKMRKGYWLQGSVAEADLPSVKKVTKSAGNQAARKGVQKHLNAALRDELDETRKLSRLIWRAGQLKLSESLKTLTKLPELDYFDEYSLAWSLGRIGSEDGLPRLQQLRNSSSPAVRRVAIEASLLCMQDEKKTQFWQSLGVILPAEWLADFTATSMAERAAWIVKHHQPAAEDEALYHLYLLGAIDPQARELAWWVMHLVPMAQPWRRSIRSIYKAAELRIDGEMYGLCARRFEIRDRAYAAAKPLSLRSSRYFSRRQRRLFKQAAKDGDIATFITFAVGVLLAYDDAHKAQPYVTSRYVAVGRRYEIQLTHFDDNAHLLGLNHLLYENSPRYEHGNNAWSCKTPYLPGCEMPAVREESQPAFWDQAPDGIKHLLGESRCARVHEFARKVWQANASFQQESDPDFACKLLGSPYPQTLELGLKLAKLWLDPLAPHLSLVVALCRSANDEARLLGLQQLTTHPLLLAQWQDITLPLLMTPQLLIHQLLRQWLPAQLIGEKVNLFLDAAISALLQLHSGQEAESTMAVETLGILCGEKFSSVNETFVSRLLAHALPALPLLGVRILLTKPIEQISDELFHDLSHSPHADVRVVGMQLWNGLSDAQLLERAALIADYSLSPLTEVRQGVGALIARLAAQDANFAEMIVLRLYPRLLREEDEVGLHEDVYVLLIGPLAAHLSTIEPGHRLRMLETPYRHSQLLGLYLLKHFIDLRNLSMSHIVKLGSAETLEVREFVWEFMNHQMIRVKLEREASVLLLDSKWEDSRVFARDYFAKNFGESEWTPELLVSLCDHTRVEIQDFGKQMITRFFQERDGAVYLQKLSQHPSSHMQLFASNYLERYAAGDLSRLQSMEWFFLSVLSRVNQGRVVKQRVLQMIRKEVSADRDTASWFMPLLARQSLTVAIEEKAAIVKILQEIHHRWPDIDSPLQVKEIPTRCPWNTATPI